MKLSEIFYQLTAGELSQLNLGGGEEGAINPANYRKMLTHINLGLTNLFTRFPLKEGRASILLLPNVLTYVIDQDNADFEEDDGIAVGGLIKIERVVTDTGTELNLNFEEDPYSCMTPSMKAIRVPLVIANQGPDLPDHLKTRKLHVIFRASHPILTMPASGVFNPDRVEVELPYTHMEALLYFVASRVHNPIGMTNEFHSGNSYAAKYEQACQQLEQFNLKVDQGSQNNRIVRNGWV